uniref:Uncharacterized protein n=1 Tax=Romanomermis culicivorax TaxID=13658 RepID=A0A915IUP0_ROMCU
MADSVHLPFQSKETISSVYLLPNERRKFHDEDQAFSPSSAAIECCMEPSCKINFLSSDLLQCYSESDLSRDATRLLDTLFDSKKYDRRVRPNFGGAPTNINAAIYLGGIDALSKASLNLNLEVYLRQFWFDDRLVFNTSIFSLSTLILPKNYPAMIWLPDTFFPNSKSIIPPQTGDGSPPNPSHSSCRISQDDAYSDDDIKYLWDKERAAFIDSATMFIPSMELLSYDTKHRTEVLTTGSYSRLSLRLLFRRRYGYYVLQFYTPLAMVTILSWLSFWLDRRALTARMLAGLIPLATATMLTFFSSCSMPHVSYFKAADIYSGFCLLVISSSLVECAIACYVNRKAASPNQMSPGKQNNPLKSMGKLLAPNILDRMFKHAQKHE